MADQVDTACITYLNTSEIVGLAFIAESGVISTVAVLIFAALVIRNLIQDRRNPGPNGPAPLIRTHVDGYMISLMFADLLQGLGAITSAKWAADGTVTCSAYCTAQGALQQLGESGVAMSTLVITVHTFATVFFRWQPQRVPWLWMVVVAFIWIFLILFVVVGYVVNSSKAKLNGQPYFGPTPFWCWIGPHYLLERIFGEYFWLWFAAFVNILLYPFLYFTLRGNIDVDPTNWRRIRFHKRGRGDNIFSSPTHATRPDTESVRMDKARNKEAVKMFWYPISYTILVLPLSINRWRTSFHTTSTTTPPDPGQDLSIIPTSIVLFIFGLSGLVNVLLFLLTRPNLLLFNVRRERRREKKRQEQSEFASAISFNHSVTYPRRRSRQYPDMDEDEYDDEEGYPGSEVHYPSQYPPPPHKVAPVPPGEDGQHFYPSEKHIVFPNARISFDKERDVELQRQSGEASSTITTPLPSPVPIDVRHDEEAVGMAHALGAPQLSPTTLSHSTSQRSIRWNPSQVDRRGGSSSSNEAPHHHPPPPAPIYSSRTLPVQPPPTGYPSTDHARPRVEEWALPSPRLPPSSP